MLLSDITWIEAREYIKKNNVLIIPIGTCEQHGYHLPLNNDILGVEYLANILSENTGALVAPTVNYGVNLPCDRFLHGTSTLTPDILKKMILSIEEWWRIQGFTKFILITFHGDPFHIEALTNITEDTFLIEPFDIEYDDILEKQDTIKHACEAETSIALYLYPEKVRMDRIQESDIPFELFRKYLYHENCDLPDDYVGNLGYPKSATREKWQIIVERMVTKMLSEYVEIVKN